MRELPASVSPSLLPLAYCRAIAMRIASSGETRGSELSAASAMKCLAERVESKSPSFMEL